MQFSAFEQLNPGDMSDDDRVAWGAVLTGEFRVQDTLQYYLKDAEFGVFPFTSKQFEWCRNYWSEALELLKERTPTSETTRYGRSPARAICRKRLGVLKSASEKPSRSTGRTV